jgi:methyl halide transferase
MSEPSRPKYVNAATWDEAYREGTPPWDLGVPHNELARVLDEYRLKPRTVLEIGCGSGADAILLARRRFEVTAVDCSPIALERARLRAEQRGDLIRFVLADMYEFGRTAGQFDFVYDSGVYDAVRLVQLDRYVDMLWRITRPGSHYLCLAAAPGEAPENSPTPVSEDEIHNELGRLFESVHLRPIRLETLDGAQSRPGWSCLMRRPVVNGK